MSAEETPQTPPDVQDEPTAGAPEPEASQAEAAPAAAPDVADVAVDAVGRAAEMAGRVVHELGDAASKAEKAVSPVVDRVATRASAFLGDLVSRGRRAFDEPAHAAGAETSPGSAPPAGDADASSEVEPQVDPVAGDDSGAPQTAPEDPPAARTMGEQATDAAHKAAEMAGKVVHELGDMAARAERKVSPVVDRVASGATTFLGDLVDRGRTAFRKGADGPDAPDAPAGAAGEPDDGVVAAPADAAPADAEAPADPESPGGNVASKAAAAASKVVREIGDAAARAERTVSPVVDRVADSASAFFGDLIRKGRSAVSGEETQGDAAAAPEAPASAPSAPADEPAPVVEAVLVDPDTPTQGSEGSPDTPPSDA